MRMRAVHLEWMVDIQIEVSRRLITKMPSSSLFEIYPHSVSRFHSGRLRVNGISKEHEILIIRILLTHCFVYYLSVVSTHIRFIFGPDVRSLLLTVSLILAPVTLFWVFVSKSLITGAFSHAWGLHIVILSVILTICIICLLFLTSGSDPGIIPRSSRPPDPDDSDTSTLSDYWPGSQISASLTPLTKNVTVNGMVVKVKYCQTCMLYRPPRCSHCSVCNNCVERFDHHCPWVGQCIGKRNYRYFFFFVSSTTLLCLYVLTSCSINIKDVMDKENCTIWRAVGYSPITGFLIIYTFVVCWFVGGLTSFHLYLIATNQTTYENFRYQYDRKMNPYNLGYAGNFKEVFWSKIPRSQNNFRATVRSDSLAGSSASSCLGSMVRPEIPKGGFSVEVEKRLAVNAGKIEDNKNQVGSFGPEPRQNTSGITEETGG